MAEELTLTDPIVKTPTTTYKVQRIELNIEPPTVVIHVLSDIKETITVSYIKDVAKDYIRFINTGNFTTISLHRRILQRLVQEGKLPPGNVTGTPE